MGSDPTKAQLENALVMADRAGNDREAQVIAQMIRELPETPTWKVAMNAIPKGVANLINTPVALADLQGQLVHQASESLREHGLYGEAAAARPSTPYQPLPNYPMKGMEALGAVRPENEPQTRTQRVADAMIQGGVGLAAVPAKGIGLARQILSGATAGGVGEAMGEATESPVAGVASNIATFLATRGKARPGQTGRMSTLKEGVEAGYVVPPSQATPTALSRVLEFVAGKGSVADDAALRNQSTTNRLAAQAIGLPPETLITEAVLKQVRDHAGKSYAKLDQLRPPPGMPWFKRYHETDLVEQYKQAKAEANALYESNRRDPSPDKLTAAKAQDATAASLEQDLERIALANNRPDLLKAFRDARVLIAKTYDVERALNLGDYNVSAHKLGSDMKPGTVRTGELKTVGQFAEAFPKSTREASVVSTPSLHGRDAVASALLGATGVSIGGPLGVLAGSLPFARIPAKSMLLSPRYQSSFVRGPKAGPTANERIAQALLSGTTSLQE